MNGVFICACFQPKCESMKAPCEVLCAKPTSTIIPEKSLLVLSPVTKLDTESQQRDLAACFIYEK